MLQEDQIDIWFESISEFVGKTFSLKRKYQLMIVWPLQAIFILSILSILTYFIIKLILR